MSSSGLPPVASIKGGTQCHKPTIWDGLYHPFIMILEMAYGIGSTTLHSFATCDNKMWQDAADLHLLWGVVTRSKSYLELGERKLLIQDGMGFPGIRFALSSISMIQSPFYRLLLGHKPTGVLAENLPPHSQN